MELNKLKSAAKNNTETILRLNKRNFEEELLPHELFVTTRKKEKKIGKHSFFSNLGKKEPTNIAIPLGKDNLPGLISNLISSAINKFDRKISGEEAVSAGKGFNLLRIEFKMKIRMIILKS